MAGMTIFSLPLWLLARVMIFLFNESRRRCASTSCRVGSWLQAAVRFIGLDVAADNDFFGGDFQLLKTFFINIVLHQETVDLPEEAPQKKTEKAVTAESRFGYAAVDQEHGNFFPVQQGNPVWPDFEFIENHQLGIDAADEALDGKRQIEWRMDDAQVRVFFAGEFIAARRGDR